jgi:hypothetical protein
MVPNQAKPGLEWATRLSVSFGDVIPKPRALTSGARDLPRSNSWEILRSAGRTASLRMTPVKGLQPTLAPLPLTTPARLY